MQPKYSFLLYGSVLYWFCFTFLSCSSLKNSSCSATLYMNHSLHATVFTTTVTFEATYRENFESKVSISGKRHSTHVVFAILPKWTSLILFNELIYKFVVTSGCLCWLWSSKLLSVSLCWGVLIIWCKLWYYSECSVLWICYSKAPITNSEIKSLAP